MSGANEISASMAAMLHLLCGFSLVAAHFVACRFYSWSLVTHTFETLRLSLIIHGPIVVGVYSFFRRDPQQCSYWRAVTHGLLALPVGALVNSFGAIVLGAPVGARPAKPLDALVSLPAYGSVIGAWIGAWPMPLDWERPWQEWPISVTYGAIAGYLVGGLASSLLSLIQGSLHVKRD